MLRESAIGPINPSIEPDLTVVSPFGGEAGPRHRLLKAYFTLDPLYKLLHVVTALTHSVLQHVWICMVFVGPTFTSIKLCLLFFYRRLFVVNQKWLRHRLVDHLVYVILWFVGATGFYMFQCWPVQWYWTRYYQRYHVGPSPILKKGQCNATTIQHVAMPLIFSLISNVALLLLPIAAISKLPVSLRRKLGLATIFSVGAL